MAASFLFLIILGLMIESNTQYINCNGGTCNCPSAAPGTKCILNCGTIDICKQQTLNCRAGDPCEIRCDAKATCSSGTKIYANTATDVIIICSADDACKADIYIRCGIGECSLQCDGSTTCIDWGYIDLTSSKSFECTGNCPSAVPAPFTASPTQSPTIPTINPTKPTLNPTSSPTQNPTKPTLNPTSSPTKPTIHPTFNPTVSPTQPTSTPTRHPTTDPTSDPTKDPTKNPTKGPTKDPTTDPTKDPTIEPTTDPTKHPTIAPTTEPTTDPTCDPTAYPTTFTRTDREIEPTKNPLTDPKTSISPTPTTSPSNDLYIGKENNFNFDAFIYVVLGICCCCCFPICAIILFKLYASNNYPDSANKVESMHIESTVNIDTEHTMDKKQIQPVNVQMSKYSFTNGNDDNDDTKYVKQWLTDTVKLPQYIGHFIQNGFDSMDIIKEIQSIEELEEINILLKGHRLKILSEIKKLNETLQDAGNVEIQKQSGTPMFVADGDWSRSSSNHAFDQTTRFYRERTNNNAEGIK